MAIPQADEHQRLMANLIGHMNLSKMPLPRFWYLPSYHEQDPTSPIVQKAALVMTGDDHASEDIDSATLERFESYVGASSGGKEVRSSSYIYCLDKSQSTGECEQDENPADLDLAPYAARGFEVGLHPIRNPRNETYVFYTLGLNRWKNEYPSLPTPPSNRTDLAEWFDYDGQPQAEFGHRIRLDTNYYYWFDNDDLQVGPPPEFNPGKHPGLFTGSGLPMRFAQANGTLIDVYQATTQMTDGSQQCYYFDEEPDPDACARFDRVMPNTVEHLLMKALGSEGYYGAFTVNAHTDASAPCGDEPHSYQCVSEKIIARAQAHEVPVLSSREMLEWLDGRSGSSFRQVSWTGNTLLFDIEAAVGSNALQAMVSTCSGADQRLEQVQRGLEPGNQILTRATIKGVEYAFFWAKAGSYVANYGTETCAGSSPQGAAGPSMPGGEPAPALPWFATEGLNSPSTAGVLSSPWTGADSTAESATVPVTSASPVSSGEAALTTGVSNESTLRSDPTGSSVVIRDAFFAELGAMLVLEDRSLSVTELSG